MPLVIAPSSATECTVPSVGIFWRIENLLLVDRSDLSAAEPYGDSLTHAEGHYDQWERWRSQGPRRLAELGYPGAIITSQYDDWPRGRVVYGRRADRFIIYADRRLHSAQTVEVILTAFGLRGQDWQLLTDAHYSDRADWD